MKSKREILGIKTDVPLRTIVLIIFFSTMTTVGMIFLEPQNIFTGIMAVGLILTGIIFIIKVIAKIFLKQPT